MQTLMSRAITRVGGVTASVDTMGDGCDTCSPGMSDARANQQAREVF